MSIIHLNPPSLHESPAFSQGTIIPAGARLLVVGGQNGVGPDGSVVEGRIGPQTEQALRNLLAVLEAAGATQEDVAKLTIHVVGGADLAEGFAASSAVWGTHRDHRPRRRRAGGPRSARRDRGARRRARVSVRRCAAYCRTGRIHT